MYGRRCGRRCQWTVSMAVSQSGAEVREFGAGQCTETAELPPD